MCVIYDAFYTPCVTVRTGVEQQSDIFGQHLAELVCVDLELFFL